MRMPARTSPAPKYRSLYACVAHGIGARGELPYRPECPWRDAVINPNPAAPAGSLTLLTVKVFQRGVPGVGTLKTQRGFIFPQRQFVILRRAEVRNSYSSYCIDGSGNTTAC